jgi:hypothetical protein
MDSVSESFQDCLIRVNPRCRVITASGSSLRRWLQKLPMGRLRLSRLLFNLSGLVPESSVGRSFQSASFGVAIARYLWYLNWLKKNAVSATDRFIISDTRDVIFQDNVFALMRDNTLYCGIESETVGRCGQNFGWYRQCYGESIAMQNRENAVLCSGVTCGTASVILPYLEALCQEILKAGTRISLWNGYDQALHTHLLHCSELSVSCSFQGESSSFLSTMVRMEESRFTTDPDGVVSLRDGGRISIVHQYDRHPKIRAAILRRFAQ